MAENRSFALLLVAVLSLPALGQSPPRKKPPNTPPAANQSDLLLRTAEAAIDKKDFAAAEPDLQKAVTADPKNSRAWFDLGFVYSATDRKPQAIEAYRRSVELNPAAFEPNLNLGVLLAGAGEPDAEKYLRAATTLKPALSKPEEGQAHAWMALGMFLEARQPAEAMRAYDSGLRLTPSNPEIHRAMAQLAEKTGDEAMAEKEFSKTIELAPGSDDAREARAGLANVFMRTRRYPQAEAALREYVSMEPGDVSAHLQLGRVLREMGRTEDSRSEFAAALKLDPNDAAVQREIAASDALAGRYAEAENEYRALVERQPKDPDLRYSLASALLQQKKYEEAEQEFLKVVQLKPGDAEAYGELAIAAAENKHYELAIKALDERARYLPDMPGTYFLRATSYDNLRAYPQAADYYHKFLVSAAGKYPDQEWQARHRLLAIEPKGKKK